MGLWSVNINEDALQEKRMAASGFYPPTVQIGVGEIVKQEASDDVPDLDEDEYSPQGSMNQPWLNGMRLSVDPAFDVPPELELGSGPTQPDHFARFLPKPSMDTFGQGLDVRGLHSTSPAVSGTTPLADTARTSSVDSQVMTGEGVCEGNITSKRAKNAAAARRSRARQTIRVQTLEAKLDSMSTDNLCLKYEVEKLRELVTRLQQKIVDHGLVLEESERLDPSPKSSESSS